MWTLLYLLTIWLCAHCSASGDIQGSTPFADKAEPPGCGWSVTATTRTNTVVTLHEVITSGQRSAAAMAHGSSLSWAFLKVKAPVVWVLSIFLQWGWQQPLMDLTMSQIGCPLRKFMCHRGSRCHLSSKQPQISSMLHWLMPRFVLLC